MSTERSTLTKGSIVWTSLLSFGAVFLLVASLTTHGTSRSSFPVRALLQQDHTKRVSSNEDCRAYVMQFLNGTTDEHDECIGFHNAWAAAQCPGDQDPAFNDDVFIVSTQECCDNMERFYLRYCAASDVPVSSLILGIIGVLLLCTVAKALLDYFKLHWLPDACVFILVGASISCINYLIMTRDSTMVHDHFYFDEDFFLQVLLPPTIFQAALSIDKPSFGRHLGPILLFAIVGTTISAISIGCMTHWMTGGYLPLMESLVFGALISSIDPVATLGILTGVGVDQTSTLYALIFGESLLNDGVAIVLFDTLQSYLGDDSVLDDPAIYISLVRDFVVILSGSIATATALGACAVLFFFLLRGRQLPEAEVASFFAWALTPYYVSEALEFSGIISILTMGFIMDFFIMGCGGRHASSGHSDEFTPITWKEIISGIGLLSPQCCFHVGFIAHLLSSIMETIIFAYLGLFVFDDKVYSMGLEQVAIWTCVISRAFMVILLSWLVNWAISCKHNNRSTPYLLDRKTQTMLFLAGIRGAVSFALVSKLPIYDMVTQQGTQFKAELKAMTSTAIIFTLFVFGVLAYFVVGRPAPSTTESVECDETTTKPLTTSTESKTMDYGATN